MVSAMVGPPSGHAICAVICVWFLMGDTAQTGLSGLFGLNFMSVPLGVSLGHFFSGLITISLRIICTHSGVTLGLSGHRAAK